MSFVYVILNEATAEWRISWVQQGRKNWPAKIFLACR